MALTVTFGSGQTNGLPLVVTAITQAGGQTLHTAIASTGVPQRIRISAQNLDPVNSHTLYVGVWALSALVPTVVYKIDLPINVGQISSLARNLLAQPEELVLNGTSFITVWADTASKIAVNARVDSQGGTASVTFGSAQTSGLPLVINNTFVVGTLPVLNNGTLLHTAPTGTNTPSVVKLSAINSDPTTRHSIAIGVFAVGATIPTITWQVHLPANNGMYPVQDPFNLTELVLNGTSFIQVWADTAGLVYALANVNTQA